MVITPAPVPRLPLPAVALPAVASARATRIDTSAPAFPAMLERTFGIRASDAPLAVGIRPSDDALADPTFGSLVDVRVNVSDLVHVGTAFEQAVAAAGALSADGSIGDGGEDTIVALLQGRDGAYYVAGVVGTSDGHTVELPGSIMRGAFNALTDDRVAAIADAGRMVDLRASRD